MAFKHARSATLHEALDAEQIHVMHQAGRIRIAIHGYNSPEDISRLLSVLESLRNDGKFA